MATATVTDSAGTKGSFCSALRTVRNTSRAYTKVAV